MCFMLFYDKSVVAHETGQFDPNKMFELIEQFEITSVFLSPTALRKLMNANVNPDTYELDSM